MKRVSILFFTAAFLLLGTIRSPAPILEETPTPVPVISPRQELSPPPIRAPKPSHTQAVAPSAAPTLPATTANGTPTKRKSTVRKKGSDAAEKEKTTALQPAKQPALNQDPFDGTWKGSINLIPARNWHGTGRLIGTFNVTLIVSNNGTAVTEQCRNASVLLRTQRDGNTIRWESSVFKDVKCSLTPDSSGKGAQVMFRNDFYGEPTATFTKTL